MRLIHKEIILSSRADVVKIYPIGDAHIGASNCAEGHLRRYVEYIKNQENAFWFGGGDQCNCIVPSDTKRYDVRTLADWIFTGDAMNIKEKLLDIAKQERERFGEIVEPIKDKCLGLISGNHEEVLMRRCYNGHHYIMCDELGVANLTDAAFIRLGFKKKGNNTKPNFLSRTIVIFIMHGHGGGRSPGAEPNHLYRLSHWVDADIILRGHSHTFRIEPRQPMLSIPRRGAIPDECSEKSVYCANWGCWLKSYATGPPTYDSMAAYPPRPLAALEISIKPFWHTRTKRIAGYRGDSSEPRVILQECPYEF